MPCGVTSIRYIRYIIYHAVTIFIKTQRSIHIQSRSRRPEAEGVRPTERCVATMAEHRQTEPVDFCALKWSATLLGLTGFLLITNNFIAGVLALCLLCKIGCCCEGDDAKIKSAIFNGGCCCCKTLMGFAVSIAVLCGLWLPLSYFFLDKYLGSVCGAMTFDYTSTTGQIAFAAAQAALAAAGILWTAAHGGAEPTYESEVTDDFAYVFVYPPDVCDFALGSDFAGVYYPKPFSSFSNYIMGALLGTNGVGFVLACLVAHFAAQAHKALKAREFLPQTVLVGGASSQIMMQPVMLAAP